MLTNAQAQGHVRCRDCGKFISYYAITKTFDGCFSCNGDQRKIYIRKKKCEWNE